VNCLAVDPTSNFLLSGSADSNIHVWSLPGLLSFSASSNNDTSQDVPLSPLRSLSSHRAAITAIVFGHSWSKNNIALSSSKDGTCIVWDYLNNESMHTFLLPTTPLCLALDPADRAAYAGIEDGSIHFIDFYKQSDITHQLYNRDQTSAITQPPPSDQWNSSETSASATLCIQVSYDGTTLLSGHQDGKIHTWDIAKGKYSNRIVEFAAPVTNLIMLRPTGFPYSKEQNLKFHHVVKPRYENFTDSGSIADGAILSQRYTFTAQLTSNLPLPGSEDIDTFHRALSHPSLPTSLLEEAAAELSSSNPNGQDSETLVELRTQNASLSARLAKAEEREHIARRGLQQREKEEWKRKQDEEIKAARKKQRRLRRVEVDEVRRKMEMGEPVGDEDVEMAGPEEDLSSSTDELDDSD